MSEDGIEEPATCAPASSAATVTPSDHDDYDDGKEDDDDVNNNEQQQQQQVKNKNRKRRLSKRERKNLKRKKKKNGGGGENDANADAAAVPSSSPQGDDGGGEAYTSYEEGYVPSPLTEMSAEDSNSNSNSKSADSKSLGKWFPKASVVKSKVCYSNDYLAKLAKERRKKEKQRKGGNNNNSNNNNNDNNNSSKNSDPSEPRASLVLFYQYVSPPWSQQKVSSLLTYLNAIATKHRTNIGGRIRVSTEGVNATVSAASFPPSNFASSNSNSNNDGGGDDSVAPRHEAARTLRHFARDLRHFDPVAFADTDFKYADDLTADRHFKELKLLPVKELVFYGLREEDCRSSSKGGGGKEVDVDDDGDDIGDEKQRKGGRAEGGVHLDAKAYHEMLKRKDAVVIDVRNHYEAAIGRFDGQMEGGGGGVDGSEPATVAVNAKDGAKENNNSEEKNGDAADDNNGRAGAEYVDPKMRKSTDFASWLAEPKTKEKLEGKTVMMFCTGGIRCERASAYLNSKMGSDVKGVYQLQGGVERYLQAFPEGGFWRGKNFVFDKREAIGAGNANGDGGVVVAAAAKSGAGGDASKGKSSGAGTDGEKKGNNDGRMLPWGTECAKCRKPWDRYVGKRKCHTCGVPVLVCDGCMSASSSARKKKKNNKKRKGAKEEGVNDAKGDKTTTREEEDEDERIRCPLCVEEGVTVPAADVEFTDNGMRNKRAKSSSSRADAASTGRDASNENKKEKGKAAKSVLKWGGGHAAKRKEKRKYSRRACQFGAECVRKDCFFYHPEREAKCRKVIVGK